MVVRCLSEFIRGTVLDANVEANELRGVRVDIGGKVALVKMRNLIILIIRLR